MKSVFTFKEFLLLILIFFIFMLGGFAHRSSIASEVAVKQYSATEIYYGTMGIMSTTSDGSDVFACRPLSEPNGDKVAMVCVFGKKVELKECVGIVNSPDFYCRNDPGV